MKTRRARDQSRSIHPNMIAASIAATILVLVTLLLSPNAHGQNLIQPTLINGRPASLTEFPASVRAGGCTATVVGERVLFIASHCVENGASTSFSVGANSYTARCNQTPKYQQGIDHDIALCVIDRTVAGIQYENLNTNPANVKVGDEVLLTGYGCIRAGGTGGNDGVYRIGEAMVRRLPTSSSYDYVTDSGGALCFGDSGGPAFKYLDDAKTQRVVISANSKGDIATTSYLASSSTQASIDFINSWSSQNNVKICGVHADALNCRPVANNGGSSSGGGSSGGSNPSTIPASCELARSQNAATTWQSCLLNVGAPDFAACDRANDLLQNCYADR